MEGCTRSAVAIVPLALAFALLKSARVSTAGAIRARYHGSTHRVLFKATSINLSQDARAMRVKEKVIAIVAMRQSTNGAEQEIRQRSPAQLHLPLCDLKHSRHYLRHSWMTPPGPITGVDPSLRTQNRRRATNPKVTGKGTADLAFELSRETLGPPATTGPPICYYGPHHKTHHHRAPFRSSL